MTYYKAKKSGHIIRYAGYMQTVAGELFSPAEYRRYSVPDRYGARLTPDCVVAVTAPKNRVYWFFGARFEAAGGYKP